jgi:hypothetical protein
VILQSRGAQRHERYAGGSKAAGQEKKKTRNNALALALRLSEGEGFWNSNHERVFL